MPRIVLKSTGDATPYLTHSPTPHHTLDSSKLSSSLRTTQTIPFHVSSSFIFPLNFNFNFLSMGKLFTLDEVSQHNNPKDCWLIINAKVYDVTKFLEDHPGGDDVLVSATGKDATDDFEDIGHSSSARAMLDEYYVGDIDTSTIPSKVQYTPPKQPLYNPDKTNEFVIKLLQFLVPLVILAGAIGIRFYTKSSA